MFRKTTISITIAAVAAIVLWAPAPASATEPPAEDGCVIVCDPFGLHAIPDYYSPSLDVTGGLVADAPVVTVVTLPEGTMDAIADPGVDLPTVPDLPSPPEEPPAPAPADPVPAPEPAPVDSPPADHTHETDSASSTELADDSSAIETTTTTAWPTIQDDDVDETAVAAIDLTPNQEPVEAFDPAMVGALGTLGLFGAGVAAFAIGRRGA